MKLKLRNVLMPSFLTTLAALVLSFVSLPQNSGYAGLFFIALSPLVFFIFIMWTLILASVIDKHGTLGKLSIIFLLTVVLQYLVIIVTMLILSGDDRNYDLDDFFTDCADLFSEVAVLFSVLVVAAIYAFLLRYNLNKNIKLS